MYNLNNNGGSTMTKKATIKKWTENTKRDRRENATRDAYKHYLNSTDYNLNDVYGKFSIFKAMAFDNIEQEVNKLNGYDLKIISHTHQFFTCGYLVNFEDEVYFIRHTANYRDCLKVSN